MNSNQNGIKNDIKTFVKIKQSSLSLDNPYIEISPDYNIVKLNKNLFTTLPKEIQLNYEVDQVFNDKVDYSFIYENITINCISNALNGFNTCIFSFGETNSEKHSLIFGSKSSYDNIAERGIFPRLIGSLLLNDNIFISYSLMCVNTNRLIDLTNFFNKNLYSFKSEDFITQSLEIKQSPNIINNISKISLKNEKELNTMIKDFNSVYSYLYEIEGLAPQLKISTSSHFIYIIYIYDRNNNSKLISNITLCELSGQDKLIPKKTNLNNSNKNSILNTKIIIDNNYTYECIKRTIKNLKFAKQIGDKYIDPSIENAKILIVLQKLSFSIITTKFIIIGSILHNVGMHDIAKSVLQFLFECRKIRDEKRIYDEGQSKSMEKTKDNLIFNLQARCKELDKENKEMSDIIKSKNDLIATTKELYHKQVDKLKALFSFEGDVNVLLGGSENSNEMKCIQKIRDAVNGIDITKQQNEGLIQQVNELKSQLDLLKNKSEVIFNDQAMLNYYNTAKEINQFDRTQLEMTLNNSQQMINLKQANEKLKQLNESYQKELQTRYEIMRNLPKAFEINNEYTKTKKKIKEELRVKQEEKNKIEMRYLQKNYDKELSQMRKKYEGYLTNKDIKINKLKELYEELKSTYNNDKESLNREIELLYEMIIDLISTFKEEFNWKSSPQLSVINYNKFIASRDNYKKHLEKTEINLNITNLPHTMKLIECQNSKTKLQELHIEASNTLKNHSIEINKPLSLNEELEFFKRKNIELKRRIADMIELLNSKKDKCSCGDKDHVNGLNVKMALKLENMINDNTKKGMIINVNERVINRLNCENLSIKEMLKKKLITEKVNYPLPSPFKKASSNSDLLYKSRSTRDIVTSYSNIRPSSKKSSLKESLRILNS